VSCDKTSDCLPNDTNFLNETFVIHADFVYGVFNTDTSDCCNFCHWWFKKTVHWKIEAFGSCIQIQWFCVTITGKYLCVTCPTDVIFLWYYLQSKLSSSLQTNSDFDAKPMVMLLGQYSTGKTTFIKHLLKTSYPGYVLSAHVFTVFCNHIRWKKLTVNLVLCTSAGAHIGPEPTTDRFVVVMVSFRQS
jgi:hypothetical protein